MVRTYSGIDSMLANRYKDSLEYASIVKESEDYGSISLSLMFATHAGNRCYTREVGVDKITYALASVIEKILDKEMAKEIKANTSQSFVVVVDTEDIVEEGYECCYFFLGNKSNNINDGLIFLSCSLEINEEGDPIITVITALSKKRMQKIFHNESDVVITSNSVSSELLATKN